MRRLLVVEPPGVAAYPVLCGDDPASALVELCRGRWSRVALIGDSNTAPRFAAPLARALRACCEQVLELSFPAGERHKTRQTKRRLEDALLEAGLGRDGCIVAVGGGVTLDLAGFVAATYRRGIAHINVATSLLAQVDAAIGGKTGVDTAHGKNLVGAFHHPHAVLLHLGALTELPALELRCGLAEAIKHAVIADAVLFEALERWAQQADGRGAPSTELLERCVAIKAEVVGADPDELGYRQVLNFGHSVAHAIEAASGQRVVHGEAVASGMILEAQLAETLCGFPAAHTARLVALLERVRLPTAPQVPFEAARAALAHDKKNRGGRLRCALPRELGAMDPGEPPQSYARDVPLTLLRQRWDALFRGGRAAGGARGEDPQR